MIRPMCPKCNQNPRAVAYHKYGRIYYRSKCGPCLKKDKNVKKPKTRWAISGYKKKLTCDYCGFKAKYASQTVVYHVDGNLHNSDLRNLKTICLNCVEVIRKSDLPWRVGDLEPDI